MPPSRSVPYQMSPHGPPLRQTTLRTTARLQPSSPVQCTRRIPCHPLKLSGFGVPLVELPAQAIVFGPERRLLLEFLADLLRAWP